MHSQIKKAVAGFVLIAVVFVWAVATYGIPCPLQPCVQSEKFCDAQNGTFGVFYSASYAHSDIYDPVSDGDYPSPTQADIEIWTWCECVGICLDGYMIAGGDIDTCEDMVMGKRWICVGAG